MLNNTILDEIKRQAENGSLDMESTRNFFEELNDILHEYDPQRPALDIIEKVTIEDKVFRFYIGRQSYLVYATEEFCGMMVINIVYKDTTLCSVLNKTRDNNCLKEITKCLATEYLKAIERGEVPRKNYVCDDEEDF